MSRARQAQSVPVNIPFRGMSTRYALASMPPEFCPWLEGYKIGAGFLESPKGVKWAFEGEAGFVAGMAIDPDNSEELVHFSSDGTMNARAWNVFAESNGSTATGGSVSSSVPRYFTFLFGTNTFVLSGALTPQVWNGSTLTNTTLTGPTMANVIGGTSHNNQIYFFEKGKSLFWFRDSVGAITGAMTSYDTKYVSRMNGNIASLFTFTLSSSLDSQNLFGVALDTGEVIIYAGIDPADTPTWRIIGRLLIGRPLGYNNFIEKDGDVLLLTDSGITSIRDTLLSDQSKASPPRVTDEIEKYWQQLVKDVEDYEDTSSYDPATRLSSYIRGVWHQKQNRLYIFTPRRLEPFQSTDGDFGYTLVAGTTILIYDFNADAWSVRSFANATEVPGSDENRISSIYYHPRKGSIYFATDSADTGAVWEIEGNARFSDNYSEPTISATSATFGSTSDTSSFAGSELWQNTSNAYASDNSYTTCYINPFSSYKGTGWLKISGFGFAIPSGANIVAITIDVEAKTTATGSAYINARLITGEEAANLDYLFVNFPTTDTSMSIGGVSSGFGGLLTLSQVNASDFYVELRYEGYSSSWGATVSIDAVSVTVHYVADLSENDSNIPLKIISAPFALANKKQHVKGWSVRQSGDTYSKRALTVQAQADISGVISGSTSNPSLPAGSSKDVYGVGVAGDLVQYIISTETTKDDDRAHKLLGISPLVEVGGEVG